MKKDKKKDEEEIVFLSVLLSVLLYVYLYVYNVKVSKPQNVGETLVVNHQTKLELENYAALLFIANLKCPSFIF